MKFGEARLLAGMLALVVLGACAPQPAPGASQGATGPGGSARGPKILTLAVPTEPEILIRELAVRRGGGMTTIGNIVHNRLVVESPDLTYVPELAAEPVSVENGTWQVNPDETMVTTWKLVPNVRWHDGTPFTSADLLFTFTVIKDPEIPTAIGAVVRVMQAAAAPDPYTFVIHWSRPFVDADQALGVAQPLARHLIEETYRNDKANFTNHPWFTREFVGLGPYRLVRWESGVLLEFSRYDGYFRGRPPLDGVVVRFIPDDNTLVANILAGEIDVYPPAGLDPELAADAAARWEGGGNRFGGHLSGGLFFLDLQQRPEYARPVHGLATAPVRRAFYHAINRPELTEIVTHGLGPVADSWIPPRHPLHAQVESAIPQYPHDPARAQQILAQAGWVRGGDGVLAHQESGDRFEVQLASRRAAQEQKIARIVADSWRRVGARVEESFRGPERLEQELEALAVMPGAIVQTGRHDRLYTDRYHSRSIASPANQWSGRNRGGYANARVDALLDQLAATIPPDERLHLHQALLQEQLGDVAVMLLYWEFDPYFVSKSARGPVMGEAWNFWAWDKE
jgi:peptide/nickel transport system substrate-binding protein